ncbi:MAG: carbamoyl-phosphate synthase large subunit, partial [Gammaproteobacteria bacterium]|nr:carbamoyl-phosphate synthase large subunit [Gammaproteobacteria bacterium]
MNISAMLIANRGEIATRIARAGTDLGVRTVAVYAEDDEASLHTRVADESIALQGTGVNAYLDIGGLIAAAKTAGCDAVHPGYGFLSERADFAEACAQEGLTFVGPSPALLALFGDKGCAREAARAADVPITKGIDRAVTLAQAQEFFASLGPDGAMIIKALAGGGGRGTRAVLQAQDLEPAFTRCQSEARTAFGREDVYVEEFIPRARHIEVQIVGDNSGNIPHLGERECSVQRRYQKVVEIAPAPGLDDGLRQNIIDAAMRFAKSVNYASLGTFEFLVDVSGRADANPFVFIETNARLQVEHTVTEQVTGVDIVQSQIQLAAGATLADIGLDATSGTAPRGYAIQARVNMETIEADGSVKPGGGTLSVYEAPSGPGVRTDGFGYAGYQTSGLYDSLLAKVICHTPAPNFPAAIARTKRALSEFRLEGVSTNIGFLHNVLDAPAFANAQVHTRWVDENLVALAATATARSRYVSPPDAASASDGFAGARVDTRDPLALFAHDAEVKSARTTSTDSAPAEVKGPDGSVGMVAPIQGTIVSIAVADGDQVLLGQPVAVVEAMKMEHEVRADRSGIVRQVTMSSGDVVREGFPIVFIEAADVGDGAGYETGDTDVALDHIRADLQESIDRHAYTLDINRSEAVAKRKKFGYRMPRENIDRLVDPDSFQEYWPLVVAFQHQRYDLPTLREKYPADGVVAGTASINGELFGDDRSRAAIVHYDYTVLAGTQGRRNHYKQDRIFELAHRFRLPMIMFAEGGGGRPGDDNVGPRVAFDTPTFTTFSQLSGLVPMVGINNGRCFAGNTALLACCDVIIATESSTIAMGGPAMIEGGGLGIYTPEEVGPMEFQVPNGVVDILV